nr:helix-turn-helix domain-containing protein [Vibrio agarivorans]
MSHTLVAALMSARTGSPISKLLLIKLADNADAQGRCFPSCQYLARYCEVSLRTVKQHLAHLEDLGFIKRLHRFDKKGRQRSNHYQLLMCTERHVELEAEHAANCTGEGAAEPLTERALTAHIINHKEKDKNKGVQHPPAVPRPDTTRPADKLIADFAKRNPNHPYQARIANLIKQRKAQMGG